MMRALMLFIGLGASAMAFAQSEDGFGSYEDTTQTDESWRTAISNIAPKGTAGIVIKVPEKTKDDLSTGELRFTSYEAKQGDKLAKAWKAGSNTAGAKVDATRSNYWGNGFYFGGYNPYIYVYTYTTYYYVTYYRPITYVYGGYYYYYLTFG